MFDIPDAKRIRRSDLTTTSRSPSRSPRPSSPDPTLAAAFQAQLSALYGPISIPEPTQEEERDKAQENEHEFEFRLFSAATTSTNANTVQKIILEDEDIEEQFSEGRFLRPRARSYYISTGTDPERKKEYALSALSGHDVLELSKKRAWGLEVPWRVKILRSFSSSATKGKPSRIVIKDPEAGIAGKKTKPGKKRRIILREKRRKRELAEEGRKKRDEEKEVAEREKRTRRNREKKVKRKMKEKAKKGGGVGGEGEAVGSGGGSGGEDD